MVLDFGGEIPYLSYIWREFFWEFFIDGYSFQLILASSKFKLVLRHSKVQLLLII